MKKALVFKSIFIIVVAISFATCLQAQELPIVQNNTIQFIGGKTLLTEDNASYFIYAAQKRLIYITRDRKPPHTIEYVVYFFDYYGNELSHTNTNEKLSGEFDFIYFEKKDRLLVAQRTVFSRARTSYLFDLNGRLIKEFSHDSQPRLIEVKGDENYFY
jgi:hypothetical protein